MEAYVVDWLNLLTRWLHLIAGIAWIGASFYFVMLDNSLSRPKKKEDAARGVSGELWAVHGGGFYCSQKYLTGPKGEPLSENLHWSKWEAYTTWLSGMGLLALIYWWGASSYLIDTNVLALSPTAAIAISIAFLAGGWIIYDVLCRTLEQRENLLVVLVLILIMAAAWALFHIFSARAAFIHVGAVIGTIMVANVFFHIIPGQKKMVADIRAGNEPDPRPGIIGKQRSVHNTYFTLPVLFTMISNLIREFFVLRHGGRVTWALPGVAVVLLVGLAITIAPKSAGKGSEAVAFAKVQGVLAQRCVGCHAAQPTQPGFAQPPKGILLDTPEHVAANAPKLAETVANRYMPLANLTQMTDDERSLIAAWFAQGAATK